MKRLSSDSCCKKKGEGSRGSMGHSSICARRESGEGAGCPAGDQGLGSGQALRGQPSKAPHQGTGSSGGQKGHVTPSHRPISSHWWGPAPPCLAGQCEAGEEADVPGWAIPLSPQISGTLGFPPWGGVFCCGLVFFFISVSCSCKSVTRTYFDTNSEDLEPILTGI